MSSRRIEGLALSACALFAVAAWVATDSARVGIVVLACASGTWILTEAAIALDGRPGRRDE